MKRVTAICTILLIALFTIVIWQQQIISRLRTELATAEAANQHPQVMVQEAVNSETKKDLEGSQKDHAELLRLRGELTRLRGQMSAMAKTPSETSSPTIDTPAPKPPSTNDFITISTNLTTELGNGQAFLFGGWDSADGKKTYAMVSAQFMDDRGNIVTTGTANTQIKLSSHLFDIPQDQLGMIQGKLSDRLSASDWNGLLEKFKNMEGVDLLAAPAVLTLNRRQAQVSMLTSQTAVDPVVINGQPQLQTQEIMVGPAIDFLPTISEDGHSMSLVIQAVITSPKH